MTEQRKKEKLTHSRKRDTNNARKRANPRNRHNDNVPKMRLPRNVEYYNLNNEFDKLYAAAKGPKIFNDLMNLILSFNNVRLAYRNIKRNKGSKTPGTDKITINVIERYRVTQLVNRIRALANNYRPGTVRRVYIPKPNGDKRPLGIPNFLDRLFQQCFKQVLEPILEAKFHPHSYGFRPIRSAKNAISRFHCHHIKPKSRGGSDRYDNLVLLSPSAHRLIHATNPDTIKKYLNLLSLNSSQMKKVNRLRQSLEIDPV